MQDVPFEDQRTVTDSQFLEHLTLPGSAGKALAGARKAGDDGAAIRIVAEHFRTRKSPRWPFYMHGTAWLEIDGRGSVLEKAEDLLRNRTRNSWPPFQSDDIDASGGELDWSRAMKTQGGSLARNIFAPELTTAFSLTGKLAYAEKVRDLMRSFAEHFPFVLEPGFHEDHDRYFGGTYNETLTVIYRCVRWLDAMHSGVLHAP
ncbi:MAG: hypothetical protein HY291_07470 [Planctomycetes bacterium]|nr:hypothetical protein [Planctomycetota bacterium]